MSKRKSIKFCLLILTFLLIFIGGCGEDGTAPSTENPGQSGDPANGGGVSSDETLHDGVDKRNLAGLEVVGLTATLTINAPDRLERYSGLPKGLNAHVASETGISTNTDVGVAQDDSARIEVTLRTGGEPKDVGEANWVSNVVDGNSSLKTLLAGYGWLTSSPSGYPGKGHVSVLYYVRGEEEYTDTNGNGKRDSGESFVDTAVDPFIDENSNDSWDTGEKYVDADNNGEYSGGNGIWDNNKYIFRNTHMLVTGRPLVGISPAAPAISGGSVTVSIVVCDRNYNQISSGSIIAVSGEGGLSLSSGDAAKTLPASASIGTSAAGQRNLIANTYTFDYTGTETPYININLTWQKGSETESLTYKIKVTN